MSNGEIELSDRNYSAVLTAPHARAARRRIIGYKITVPVAFSTCAMIAAWTATSWPMRGHHIQASFFLSLVASTLTLFGLVFTLCLIGTQLVATRTQVSITRIFSVITWLYLALFLVTTLWTLEISYHAGSVKTSPTWCRTIIIHRCISEVQAGRFSIFGLVWSLLFLLPFIFYIYWRLSPRYNFTHLVGRALCARNESTLKQRCRRLSEEIISVAFDPAVVTEGLSQLLELGGIGARRKRPKGTVTAESIAGCLSRELVHLNYHLVQETPSLRQVLHAYREWSLWLIGGTRHPREAAGATHSVEPGQVGRIARGAVKSATRNLRLWENASSEEACARASIDLMQGIVEACDTSNAPIRVRISEATIELADCVANKLIEGPRGDFNLAFRSLIKTCELTSKPRTWSLGGGVSVREIIRTLKNLGAANESRSQVPSWILDELHNLADSISLAQGQLAPDDLESFLQSIALLKDEEIKSILAGPGLDKLHKLRGKVEHSWEAVILRELYAAGRLDTLKSSQSSAVGRCANDGDLPGLIALFEQLGEQYIATSELEVQPLLITAMDSISSRFRKNLCLVSSSKLPDPKAARTAT